MSEKNRYSLRTKLLLSGFLAVLASAVLLFLLRAPVVLVSDEQFETLHGKRRDGIARLATSVALWRKVELAIVAPSAPPEAAAEAAAAYGPACAVFPFRYAAGADSFAARFPEIPAIVTNAVPRADGADGAAGAAGAGRVLSASVDGYADWRRAGRAAGILCAAETVPAFLTEKDGSPPSPELQASFAEGLASVGYSGVPIILRSGTAVPVGAKIGCLVLAAASPAARLAEFPGIPLIIFTWLDSALLPGNAAVVFDDSPWALLLPAARAALRSESSTASSKATVSKTGGLSREMFASLSSVLRK